MNKKIIKFDELNRNIYPSKGVNSFERKYDDNSLFHTHSEAVSFIPSTVDTSSFLSRDSLVNMKEIRLNKKEGETYNVKLIELVGATSGKVSGRFSKSSFISDGFTNVFSTLTDNLRTNMRGIFIDPESYFTPNDTLKITWDSLPDLTFLWYNNEDVESFFSSSTKASFTFSFLVKKEQIDGEKILVKAFSEGTNNYIEVYLDSGELKVRGEIDGEEVSYISGIQYGFFPEPASITIDWVGKTIDYPYFEEENFYGLESEDVYGYDSDAYGFIGYSGQIEDDITIDADLDEVSFVLMPTIKDIEIEEEKFFSLSFYHEGFCTLVYEYRDSEGFLIDKVKSELLDSLRTFKNFIQKTPVGTATLSIYFFIPEGTTFSSSNVFEYMQLVVKDYLAPYTSTAFSENKDSFLLPEGDNIITVKGNIYNTPSEETSTYKFFRYYSGDTNLEVLLDNEGGLSLVGNISSIEVNTEIAAGVSGIIEVELDLGNKTVNGISFGLDSIIPLNGNIELENFNNEIISVETK